MTAVSLASTEPALLPGGFAGGLGPAALGLFAGAALGLVHLGGLLVTVRAVARGRAARAWLVASFLLRSALALGCFLALAHLGALPVVTALVGFLAVRVALTMLALPRGREREG